MLVLDSAGVSRLAERSPSAAALISALQGQGLWPPVVPSIVLVECLTGDGSRDAAEHRLLRMCDILERLPSELARRAAYLRSHARRGSAVDALVVATAEPGGTVLTADPGDLQRLAAHASAVTVHAV